MDLSKLKPYYVKNFDNIRHMVDLAAEEAGDKISHKYIENKEVKEVTFKEFKIGIEINFAVCSIALSCQFQQIVNLAGLVPTFGIPDAVTPNGRCFKK